MVLFNCKPGKSSAQACGSSRSPYNVGMAISQHHRQVWDLVAEIPEGLVLTYGQAARLAGLGRGARLVSQALRAAPEHLNLPWHRVINAKGMISFPVDSPQYIDQQDRLAEEGVEFMNERIDLNRFGYQAWLDTMLWKPDDLTSKET